MAKHQWIALTDEKQFEDLVNDLCKRRYDLDNFQLFGRKGQKQYGIDGFAQTQNRSLILHQCKNKMLSRDGSSIQKELLKDLEQETISMVEEFIVDKKYSVECFIFANSFKQDTQLQHKAIELSSKYSIEILIWSWDEISNMLDEYLDVAQKYYPNFFINEKESLSIQKLTHEKPFFEKIFTNIQREEPVLLLSITSSPYHNKITKYYKDKIFYLAKDKYSKQSIFSIQPPSKIDISEAKYFSKLGKQCGFEEKIEDSMDFIEVLEERLAYQDIFLLISEFENGSDEHRQAFALALRPLFENSYNYNLYAIIFGRKKLASLRFVENEYGISPLNYFEEYLLPLPTIEDYKEIEKTEKNLEEIYILTGGHPELMRFCIRTDVENYRELILDSKYGSLFFQKYAHQKERLLKLFEEEFFGQFSLWSNDTLLKGLFWDNLIVEDGSRFRWIAPIVTEMGKRYFR